MSSCPIPDLTPLATVEAKSLLPKDWTADLSAPLGVDLTVAVTELIRRTTSRMPQDIIDALAAGRDAEVEGSRSANTLDTMLENIKLADEHVSPLCQDTGSVIFWVRHPFGFSQRLLRQQLRAAVREATSRSWLRPNCVEALSGKNRGDNMDPFGEHHPVIHFEEWEKPEVSVQIMLKGGGSENVGAQYRLPDAELGAGRDLGGVRKCVIDAVTRAQGQGCAPGILGVAIGGDRVTSFEMSKEAVLRKLGTPNPDPKLDAMEQRLTEDLNSLGIGPMGYGGHTTVLGVRLRELYRHPASFYVSISYMCWSSRRMELHLDAAGHPSFS